MRSSIRLTTPAATCAGTSTWPPAWRLAGRKLLVLRYNPDAFKIAGVTRRTAKKERHAQLIRLLGGLLAREPEAPFTRRDAENSARCPAWRSTGPSPCAPCHAAPSVRQFFGRPGQFCIGRRIAR